MPHDVVDDAAGVAQEFIVAGVEPGPAELAGAWDGRAVVAVELTVVRGDRPCGISILIDAPHAHVVAKIDVGIVIDGRAQPGVDGSPGLNPRDRGTTRRRAAVPGSRG